ncbi:DUF1836 domain-containing protein [Bacillus tuaregi]|uniref:DUF1836 domain-containing protein n=1 Tax=Bacillus tuaregi TaxID=1816695 RepID=UPI0008F7FFA5|nr:DUF1836 domain-containing protein [Bacillus tuaregi]
MENMNKWIDKLGLDNNITLEDMPNLDLYMDQVIQLFESRLNSTKRGPDDKVLTKTMINNYAKGKLLIPIKNKKYSKEHLILISLIYQLKGALSINDIKLTLDGINEKAVIGDMDLEGFYRSYLKISQSNVQQFMTDMEHQVEETAKEIDGLKDKDAQYLERVLLITSLTNISNLYRRAAERLVDEITLEKKGE